MALALALALSQTARGQRQYDNSFVMHGSFDTKTGATGYFTSGNADEFEFPVVLLGEDGKIYRLARNGRNIREIYVDGERVPDAEMAGLISGSSRVARYVRTRRELDSLEQKESELDKEQESIEQEDSGLNGLESEADQLAEKIDKLEAKQESVAEKSAETARANRSAIEGLRRQLERINSLISKKREQLSRAQEELSTRQEQIAKNMERAAAVSMQEMDRLFSHLIGELRAAGLLPTNGKISFRLSNRDLTVNGKTASSEIFHKLKAKYVGDTAVAPSASFGLLYNWPVK